MQRKHLVLAALAVLVLAAGLALWLARSPGGTPGEDTAGGSEDTIARLSRRRAERLGALDVTPARIAGRVTDATTGAPIPGATLVLGDHRVDSGARLRPGELPRPATAVTDDDGRYAVDGLLPGAHTVAVTADGYLPSSERRLVLRPGEGRDGVDFALSPGGLRLLGTVTDIGGGPIAGVLVQAQNLSEGTLLDLNRPSYGALTDATGAYRLSLAPGTYTVAASHVDYIEAAQLVQVLRDGQVADFTLVPGGTIHGQVLARSTGKPVPGAMVVSEGGQKGSRSSEGFNLKTELLQGVVTDAEGRFVLRGLGSGAIELRAVAQGFASTEPTLVEMGVAEQVTGVELWVDDAFMVSGFVVRDGHDQTPIPGVLVGGLDLRAQSVVLATDVSDADGYFEIHGVRPGRYLVAAFGEEVVPNLLGTSFTVEDQDVDDVLVVMRGGATLSGQVQPPQVATLTLEIDFESLDFGSLFSSMAAALIRGRSGEDGRFVLQAVPPGKFKLVARTDDGKKGSLDVEVAAEDQSGLLLSLDDRASVSGRVVDEKGRPVAGVEVEITPTTSPGTFGFSVSGALMDMGQKTGPDGAFEVHGLDPGPHTVTVQDERGVRPFARRHADEGPLEIEIQGARDITGLELVVESADEIIRGIVVGPGGAPVPDAWVTAQFQGDVAFGERAGDAMDPLPYFHSTEPPVLAGLDGRFELRGLRRGIYQLRAQSPRDTARGRLADVKTGSRVTIVLSPLATLVGQVTFQGTPVPRYTATLQPGYASRPFHDPDGRYRIDRLDPGEVTLTVVADEGSGEGTATLAAGETVTLDLALVKWGSVRGRIVDAVTGKPIKGVSLFASTGSNMADAEQGLEMVMGGGPKTDSDGRFHIGRLGPGEGHLTAFQSGLFSDMRPVAQASFTLEPGQDLDLGTIRGVAGESVDKDERGTLGLGFEVSTYAGRSTANAETDSLPPHLEPEALYLWITGVAPDGPAAAAGLQAGDRVTSIDGHDVNEMGPEAAQLLVQMGRVRAGQVVVFGIDRGGQTQTVSVTAAPLPEGASSWDLDP